MGRGLMRKERINSKGTSRTRVKTSSSKTLTMEQLAEALARLSLNERKALVKILDRKNLKARRNLARRENAKGKIMSESESFK